MSLDFDLKTNPTTINALLEQSRQYHINQYNWDLEKAKSFSTRFIENHFPYAGNILTTGGNIKGGVIGTSVLDGGSRIGTIFAMISEIKKIADDKGIPKVSKVCSRHLEGVDMDNNAYPTVVMLNESSAIDEFMLFFRAALEAEYLKDQESIKRILFNILSTVFVVVDCKDVGVSEKCLEILNLE